MNYLAGQNNTIDTGEVYFGEIAKTNLSGRKIATKFLKRDRILNLPIYDGKSLEARIEFSRWIVDCPNCKMAEFAFEDKLFFCSQCHNSDIQGKVRKVKMPKERKKIEGLLIKRKLINRHWANEKIEQLEEENKILEVS